MIDDGIKLVGGEPNKACRASRIPGASGKYGWPERRRRRDVGCDCGNTATAGISLSTLPDALLHATRYVAIKN